MKRTSYTKDIVKLISNLPKLTTELDTEIKQIDDEMEVLKKAGLTYATEWWRKDSNNQPKYFYLLYPTKAGEKRKREYIGCDAVKIKACQEAIARASKYEELKEQKRTLELRADSVLRKLKETEGAFTGNSSMAWAY